MTTLGELEQLSIEDVQRMHIYLEWERAERKRQQDLADRLAEQRRKAR